jgi:hypothetical protein
VTIPSPCRAVAPPLILGALGGLGAVAAQAFGRPLSASGGGAPVTLGVMNKRDAIFTAIERRGTA